MQTKVTSSLQRGGLSITLFSYLFFNCNQGGAEVRWNFVHGLFENAIYGGRIDNTYDLNVLKSYLYQYFESNVVTGGQVMYLSYKRKAQVDLLNFRLFCWMS